MKFLITKHPKTTDSERVVCICTMHNYQKTLSGNEHQENQNEVVDYAY